MSNELIIDEEMEPDPELNLITNEIIGAAIEVHGHHLAISKLTMKMRSQLSFEGEIFRSPGRRRSI